MKRYFSLIIFMIIVVSSTMVFATTSSNFEVVEDNVCTIKINDYCEFEKKMVSYDLDKRQVTIQMKVTNDDAVLKPSGEIMLVIDNSSSMEETTSTGEVRKSLVFNSANELAKKLLNDNENLKIGAVSFSTNNDVSKEGTIEDATLVSELTSDVSTLSNNISNIQATGARTDLDAGLTLASNYFSNEDNNKYLIVLTDGLPNVAIDYDKVYFSDDVIAKTKAKLQNLSESYNIITMLTGISASDEIVTNSTYTYAEYIEQVFGTTTNPVAGKFYNIQDEKIQETIANDIYSDLLPISGTVTDINITDYFPQDIIDNFDFAYVADPNIGTISAKIDTSNRCIVWTISELNPGETAIVQYTLTLKENYNENIVDVILDTNEKVDITYIDVDGTAGEKTSDETPKVKVTESTDTTTATKVLPKTGSSMIIVGILLVIPLSIVSGIILFVVCRKINKF